MGEDMKSVNPRGFWKHHAWSEACDTVTVLHYVPRCVTFPIESIPECMAGN